MKAKPYRALSMCILSLMALLALMARARAATPSLESQVHAAWARAQRIGAYRFSTDIRQIHHPRPLVTNAGLSPRQEAFRLEGAVDLPAQTLRMRLWQHGGSVLDPESAIEFEIGQGVARARAAGGVWQEIERSEGLFSPAWDPLAYLSGARALRALGVETRRLPDGAMITFNRYGFTLDGPSLAAYIQGRFEDYLRSNGKLPPEITLEASSLYRAATGQGEIWLDERGLPLRLFLDVSFPESDTEQTTATIATDFIDFGPEFTLAALLRPGGAGALLAAYLPASAVSQGLTYLAMAAISLLLALALILFSRARFLYVAVVYAVILSLIVTPCLSSQRVRAFFEEWGRQGVNNPPLLADRGHASLPAANTAGLLTAAGAPSGATFDACMADGANSDIDNDGLTCTQEMALGTDPYNPDSDGDLIPDGVEVSGFEYAGQTWYTDPQNHDSNHDGLSDGIECPSGAFIGDWATYRYTPMATACQDSDGDGAPDVADRDNDGDGVPDDADAAPMSRIAQADSFGLIVDGLQANLPVFVDVQIRPAKDEHLWWALSVLDWPSGDEEGQVQRKAGNDATYADIYPGATDPRFRFGDMRLAPMLEISIPWNAVTRGNLPVRADAPATITSQTDLQAWLDNDVLQAYGVAIKRADDLGNLLAYVPLNLVMDGLGGARVAFSARMPYRPSAPLWGQAHQMRLVWLVHALTDVCTAQDGEGACTQWSLNNEQIIQTYYEPFTLAGLSVREERGVDVAVIYNDPSVAAPAQGDALWALADKLEATFIDARDSDGNGQRDITVPEIARRFDHASNGAISLAERWGINNALSVATLQYAGPDEMIAGLMTTDVEQILTGAFGPGDAPTLLFASEQAYRAASLDHHASVNGGMVTIAMGDSAPTVLAAMRWKPYAYRDGAWGHQSLDAYLDGLSAYVRGEDAFFGPDAPGNDSNTIDFKVALLQSYYISLAQGVSSLVQEGDAPLTHDSPVATDDWTLAQDELAVGNKFKGYSKYVVKAAYILSNWYQNRQFAQMMERMGYQTAVEVGGITRKLDGVLLQAKSAWQELEMSVQLRWEGLSSAGRVGALVGAGVLVAGVGVGLYLLLGSDRDTANKVQIATASLGVAMTALSIVQTISKITKAGSTAVSFTSRLASASQEITKEARSAAIVGAIIAVGVTVGFFIYSMIHAGVSFGSLEFDAALASTIGTAVALVIMIAIAFIPVVGQIIALVLGLIDAVVALVCGLAGESADSSWVCNGITGWLAKGIAWAIYGQHMMVDLENADRLRTYGFGIDSTYDSSGFAQGSELSYHVSVTNTIAQADLPIDPNIVAYLWQWTDDRVKSSAFRYGLSQTQDDISVSRGESTWQGDDPWRLTNTVTSHPIPLPEAGLNRALDGLYLNEGYAVPTQECWGLLLLSVCYVRQQAGTHHFDLGKNLKYDVFPATLDGLHALAAKGGGYALAWGQDGAITFPALRDADGDGLLSAAYGGADPDDSLWDTDGDGLSDPFELQAGTDPNNADTDLDGLSDRDELLLGLNPHLADSDGDGLSDAEEVQGWLFVYGFRDAAPLKTRVWPDALRVDVDADGYSDVRERIFGFHPRVPSASAILSLDAQIGDLAADGQVIPNGGYAQPGQTLHYEAKVTNDLDERYAQGLLETEFPEAVREGLLPQSFVLHPRDESTLTGNIQIASDAATGLATVTQIARAQITDPGELLGAPRIRLDFDEALGATTFLDSAGVAPPYNATCSGSACPTAGVDGLVGQAIRFDGVDDYLSISDFSFGSQVAAYSVWVKPDSVVGAHAILMRGNANNTLGVSLGIKDGQVWVGGNTGAGWQGYFAGTVRAGEWTQIAVVYREYATAYWDRHRCEVYQNGEQVAVLSECAFQLDSAGFATHIGKNQASDTQFFAGVVDDLRIYTHAPTNWHIPVLAMGFDQGKFADDSDYANSVTCSPSCPTFVDGLSGQAASFDGGRYLSIALPGIDLNQYTLAAWVYPTDTGYSAIDAAPQGVLGVNATNVKASPHIVVVGDKVRTGFGTGSVLQQFTTGSALSRNTWNHIAITFGDGAKMLRVYVNGVEIASYSVGANPNNAMYYTKMTQLGSAGLLGDFAGSADLRLFHGKIDGVAIYRESLSAEEVANVYQSGAEMVLLAFDDPAGGSRSSDVAGKTYLQNAADGTGLHNGACQGASCPVLDMPGRQWRAALFDGVDDVVTLENSQGASFGFGGASPIPFSLAAWVYPQSPGGVIVGKFNLGVEGAHFLSLTDDGKAQFHRETSPWNLVTASALPLNRWSHIVGTYDGATMRVYLNGHLATSMASAGGIPSAPNTPVTVGAMYANGNLSRFFHGMLDDVRIYRKGLVASEVLALYNSAPSLQMRFDEPQGATTFVEAANGLDGSCSGNACPLAGVQGQVGLAASLDGVDDHLQIPDSDALDFDTHDDFAVMLWVRPEAQQADIARSDNDIVEKWSGTGGYPYVIRYLNEGSPNSGHLLAARYDGTYVPQLLSSRAIDDGQFHHVAFVKSGSALSLYVDGALDSTTTDTTVGRTTNDSPLYIGRRGNSINHFRGTIDELHIYRRALSPLEVSRLFRAQSALVEDRQHTYITIDAEAPVSLLRSQGSYQANRPVQLLITASDGHSGVAGVEWAIDGAWRQAPPCRDATGAAFCPTFAPAGEGRYRLQTRATDKVGNVESPAGATMLLVDGAPPQVGVDVSDGELVRLLADPEDATSWRLPLTGVAVDPPLASGDAGSGVAGVYVMFADDAGTPIQAGLQQAHVAGGRWEIAYPIHDAAPNGRYVVQVSAEDGVGNVSDWVAREIAIDASAPQASLSFPRVIGGNGLAATDAITETGALLQGVISDTVGAIHAGVAGLDIAFAPDLPGSPLYNEPPLAGQVLFLSFDDMPNQHDILRFVDISGQGHDGACIGEGCPQTGVLGHNGYAAQFDGAGDYVSADAVYGSVAGAMALSFGAWVYPLSSGSQSESIVAFDGATGPSQLALFYDAKAQRFGYRDAVAGMALSAQNFPPERWHHVLIVLDAAHNGALYVNGLVQATVTTDARPVGEGRFSVGQAWDGASPGSFFKGRIDDVRVLTRALSPAEVYALYQGSGPVLQLAFDESRFYPDGASVRDESGWGQTIAVHSGGLALSTAPGKVGRFALALDGVDDRLIIGQPLGFPSGDMPYSLMAWIKPVAMAHQGILAWGGADANQRAGLVLLPHGLRHAWGDDSLDVVTNDLSGAWRHVAATYDGATRRLYLDGIEIARDSRAGHAAPDALQGFVGKAMDGSHFAGEIDDVQVYPRALSATEISAMAAGGWRAASLSQIGELTADWSYATPSGLEGHYRLDLRAVDQAGNDDAYAGGAWHGAVDTMAPRVTLKRETLAFGYRYTAVAQDFNLSEDGFSSPCGVGIITSRQSLTAPWYLASFEQDQTAQRLYQLTATCVVSAAAPEVATACDLFGHCATASGAVASAGLGDLPSLAEGSEALDAMRHIPLALSVTDVLTSSAHTSAGYIVLSGAVSNAPIVASVRVTYVGEPLDAPLEAVFTGVHGRDGTWRAAWNPGVGRALDGITLDVTVEATDLLGRMVEVTEPVTIDVTPPPVAQSALWDDEAGTMLDAGAVITASNARLRLDWATQGDPADLGDSVVTWTATSNGAPNQITEIHAPTDAPSSLFAAAEAQRVSVQLGQYDRLGNARWQSLGPVIVDGRMTPDYVAMDDPSGPYRGWMESGCALMGVDARIQRQAAANTLLDHEQSFYVTWDANGLRLAWTGANWQGDGDLFIYLDVRAGGSAHAYNPYSATITNTAILMPDGGIAQAQMAADYAIWVQDSSHARLLAWDEVASAWQDAPVGIVYLFEAGPDGGITDLYLPFEALGIADPSEASLSMVALATEERALRLWAAMPPRNSLNSDRLLQNPQPGRVHLFALSQKYTWESLGAGVCPNGAYGDDPQQHYRADATFEIGADPVGITYHLMRDGLFGMMDRLEQFSAREWYGALGEICQALPDDPLCARPKSLAVGEFMAHRAIPQAPDIAPPGYGPATNSEAATAGSDANAMLHTLMDTDHPAVSDGQYITYTLRYANLGTKETLGLTLDVATRGPLRLLDGQTVMGDEGEFDWAQFDLGDLAPGQHREITFIGQVDLGFDGQHNNGWASILAVAFDAQGDASTNQHEWLYVDHEVDQNGPEVGIHATPALIGAGPSAIVGYSFDQSAVPTVTLQILAPDGAESSQACHDPSPDDGRWTCAWDAPSVSDGAIFQIRARGVDLHGQVGVWSRWVSFTQDLQPPTIALDAAVEQALMNGVIGVDGLVFRGTLSDNHLVKGVEACHGTGAAEVCDAASLSVSLADAAGARPLWNAPFTYEDAPPAPLPLGAAQTCDPGSLLTRTFAVGESFPIASAQVGLNIDHPFRSDVRAWLVAPSGSWINLLYAGAQAENYDVLLSDDASLAAADDRQDHSTSLPFYDRARRPHQPFAHLEGEPSQGEWRLVLCDAYPQAGDGSYRRARLILTADILPEETQASWLYRLPGADAHDSVTRTLTAYGLDSVGNRIAPQHAPSLTFQVDVVAPSIAITRSAATAPLGESTVVIEGMVSDGGRIDRLLVWVETPSGRAYADHISMPAADRWEYALTPQTSGVYRLRVQATDRAGNSRAIGPISVVAYREPKYVHLPVLRQ